MGGAVGAGGVGVDPGRAFAALQAPGRPPARPVSSYIDGAAWREPAAAAARSGVNAGCVRTNAGERPSPLCPPITRDSATFGVDTGPVKALAGAAGGVTA